MVTRRVISGLSYIHSLDCVHRDLKLENILLKESGKLGTAKIADFGFARCMQRANAPPSGNGNGAKPAASSANESASRASPLGPRCLRPLAGGGCCWGLSLTAAAPRSRAPPARAVDHPRNASSMDNDDDLHMRETCMSVCGAPGPPTPPLSLSFSPPTHSGRHRALSPLSRPPGTPHYMAPEVIGLQHFVQEPVKVTAVEGYSTPADMWSYGVMLYRMMSGANPFHGRTQETLFREIANGAIDMVRAAPRPPPATLFLLFSSPRRCVRPAPAAHRPPRARPAVMRRTTRCGRPSAPRRRT